MITSRNLHGVAVLRRLASLGIFSLVNSSNSTVSNIPGLGRTVDNFVGAAGKRVEQLINNTAERLGRGPTALAARFLNNVSDSLPVQCVCRRRQSKSRLRQLEDVLAGMFGETDAFFCDGCEAVYFRTLYEACQVDACEKLVDHLRQEDIGTNCLAITYIISFVCILPSTLPVFLALELTQTLRRAIERHEYLERPEHLQGVSYLAQGESFVQAILPLTDSAEYLGDLMRTRISRNIPYVHFRDLCSPLLDSDKLSSSSSGHSRSFMIFCAIACMRHVSQNRSHLLEPFSRDLVLFSFDYASDSSVFRPVAWGHSLFMRKIYGHDEWLSHSDEVWDVLWIPLLKQLAYSSPRPSALVLLALFLRWGDAMLGVLSSSNISLDIREELQNIWQFLSSRGTALPGITEDVVPRIIKILPRVFAFGRLSGDLWSDDGKYLGTYPNVDALDVFTNTDHHIAVRTIHESKILGNPFLYLVTSTIPFPGLTRLSVYMECRRTHSFFAKRRQANSYLSYGSIIREDGTSFGLWPLQPYVPATWQTVTTTLDDDHEIIKSLKPGDRFGIWIMPQTYLRVAEAHLFTRDAVRTSSTQERSLFSSDMRADPSGGVEGVIDWVEFS